MARYPAWAVFVVTAALVVGCEPAKELPTDAPKVDRAPPPQPAAPAKSEPEAKAVVDRAVLALTGGKPELLAKAKNCRCVLKGQMFSLAQPNQPNDANRTVATVWPDKFFSFNERFPPGADKVRDEAWLRRPDLAISTNGVPASLGNVALLERYLAADVLGQNWMPLLLPATDPNALLFELQSVTLEKRDLRVLNLALGEYPIFNLMFDAKTDALIRVEYTNNLNNVSRRTTMIFADHKPIPEGLVLPTTIECRHNGSVVEKFTVEKWELPAEIKDEEFSPPKK